MESDAFKSIVKIRSLQKKYALIHNEEYAKSFDELIRTSQLDKMFSSEKPVVDEYEFTMEVSESTLIKSAFYSISADPMKSSKYLEPVGSLHFYYDSNVKVIKFTEKDRPANANDPSI